MVCALQHKPMKILARNELKVALAEQRTLIGLWCNYANAATVETLAEAGYDWLLLEMEHAPNDLPTLHAQLMAVRGSPTFPIVRVPVNDVTMIKRVLDLGTTNLMVHSASRSPGSARTCICWCAARMRWRSDLRRYGGHERVIA
jgi:2-keto-3-deoxy-L-rhamnonate aldolase RhmA